jgi:hypothetical protein
MAIVHPSFHAFFPADRQFEQPIFDLFYRPKDPFEPRPPDELRSVHDRIFLGRVWERILHHIRNPAQQAFLDDGDRQVHVLGSALFHFDAEGIPVTFMWHYRAGGKESLLPVSSNLVAIGDTPHGDTWLEALRPGFAAELERRRVSRHLEPQRNLVAKYARWAFARYAEAIRRHCDLRVMRRRVGAVLALDPFLLSVARRIRLDFGHADYASLREYTHVAKHREAYEKLAVEAPHLMALFAACASRNDFPRAGEPLERLCGYLRAQKRSPRLWRLLVKAPRNPIRLVFRIYRGAVGEAALDYLRILDHLGVHELPPDWLVWNMLQIQADPKVPRLSWWNPFRDELGTYRHIARWVEEAAPAEREAMRGRLYPVLSWLIDRKIHAFDAPQRKAGWKRLEARVARAERDRAEYYKRTLIHWQTPWRGERFRGPYTVHPIESAVALWEEGRAMHHCVDRYGPSVFEGKRAVFSVRESATGKRVATVVLVRKKEWELQGVAGFANRPVSEAVAEVARLVERRANLEEAERNVPTRDAVIDEQVGGCRDITPCRKQVDPDVRTPG